jgi:Asp/Glu/hydantoin racemase
LCADVAMQSGMKVTTVSTAEEAISILENSASDILMSHEWETRNDPVRQA